MAQAPGGGGHRQRCDVRVPGEVVRVVVGVGGVGFGGGTVGRGGGFDFAEHFGGLALLTSLYFYFIFLVERRDV